MSKQKSIFTLVLATFVGSLVLFLPQPVKAQLYADEAACLAGSSDAATFFKPDLPKSIRLQVYIPGLTDAQDAWALGIDDEGNVICTKKPLYYVADLETYISNIYKFFIGLVALGAVGMIMIGGFSYVLAGGNQTRIGAARSMIAGAVGGLALSLLSFVLLNTINPRITSLDIKKVNPIKPIARATFCSELPTGTAVTKSLGGGNYSTAFTNWDQADCGNFYNIVQGNTATQETCLGDYCASPEKCFQNECVDALVVGTLTPDADDSNRYVSYVELVASHAIHDTYIRNDLDKNISTYAIGEKNMDLGQGLNLFVLINDPGFGNDEWYAVKTDCSGPMFVCKKDSSYTCPADIDSNVCPDTYQKYYETTGSALGQGPFQSCFSWKTKADIPPQCNINAADYPEDYQF